MEQYSVASRLAAKKTVKGILCHGQRQIAARVTSDCVQGAQPCRAQQMIGTGLPRSKAGEWLDSRISAM